MTPSSTFRHRFTRAGAFVAFLLLMIGLAFAQEQSPQSQNNKSSSSSSTRTEGQQERKGDHERSLAGKLAEETREAAGEDENAKFKNSWSIRKLAQFTHLSPEHAFWLATFLNFAVVAGAIVWAWKKFLPGMFRDRTLAIQKAMEEARKASTEARARLSEIEARLSRLDVEIADMRTAAEKEAAAEEARILAAAEADKRKVIESAEHEITAAVKQARRELAAYAADLAVAHAQKQIRVDAEADQVLVRGFAEQIAATNPKKDGN
jgi:F-type H+-transporting ATPase subunit b